MTLPDLGSWGALIAITAMATGAGDPDLSTAFASLGDDEFDLDAILDELFGGEWDAADVQAILGIAIVAVREAADAQGVDPEPYVERLKALAGSRLANSGDIVLDARRFRTQEANRADARERLAELIEAARARGELEPVDRRSDGRGASAPGADGGGPHLQRAGQCRQADLQA